MSSPAIPALPGEVRYQRSTAAAQVEHPGAEPASAAVGRRQWSTGAPLVHGRGVGDLWPPGALSAAACLYRLHSAEAAGSGRYHSGAGARLRPGASGE